MITKIVDERLALLARAQLLIGFGAALAAFEAGGQESVPTNSGLASSESGVEELVVTGSRIQVADGFSTGSPMVALGNDVLRDSGQPNLEQVLNRMPQFVASATTVANDPNEGGQAFLDLRGLGANRTLVLLNGRRLPPSNASGITDINNIPQALIERVEVVTGGGSAVYGSDAIAGVVNFVTRSDFDGVQLNGYYGETWKGDGQEWTAEATLGANFDDNRGNAVLAFQYLDRESILQGDRDFSKSALLVRQSGITPASVSGTILEGRFDVGRSASALFPQGNRPTPAAYDQVFGGYGFAAGTVQRQNIGFNDDGTLFSTGNSVPGSVTNFRGVRGPTFNDGTYGYDFAPYNYLSLPAQRWNAVSMVHYDLTDNVEAYGHLLYTSYESTTQRAPTALATAGSLIVKIPVTNAYVQANPDLMMLLNSRPDPNADFYYRQRMEGIGNRPETFTYDNYQFLGGLRGKVGQDYNWDVYVAKGNVDEDARGGNDVALAAFNQLVSADGSANPPCEGGYNPLGRNLSGNLSSDCAGFLRAYATNRTSVLQSTAEATFGGRAFSMPAGDAKFSLGVAWREESVEFDPDQLVARDQSVGFAPQTPFSGSFDVKEYFGELYLPLLKDVPFAKLLSATIGARVSDHSRSGAAESWKAETQWQPVETLRFRGSVQRAVRSPSIGELFNPIDRDFAQLYEDPCEITSGARTRGPRRDAQYGGTGEIRDLCIAQLEPVGGAALVDSYITGFQEAQTDYRGNPDLQEERGITYTLGFVFEPQWSGLFENVRGTLDFYDISIDDAIYQISGGEVMALCFGFGGNNPDLDPNDPICQLIDRTPFVPDIHVPYQNVGEISTRGIDAQLDWPISLGRAGSLGLSLLTTYVDNWTVQYGAGAAEVDFAGVVGESNGETIPDWKLTMRADWHLGAFGVGLVWTHIPELENKYKGMDPTEAVGAPAVDYLDFNVSWKPTDRTRLLLGVVNVTDKDPPLISAAGQMNTDPSTYDVLGRRWFLRVQSGF